MDPVRLARIAGRRPKTMPVTNVRMKVNVRMRGSGYAEDQQRLPLRRHQREQSARQREGDPQTDDAACAGEHETLDQELSHEASRDDPSDSRTAISF